MTEVSATALVRPWWRKARLWLTLALVIAVGGVLVGTLSQQPGRPLDPASARPEGSKALVRLLARYGAPVHATSSVANALTGASSAILVVAPDEYSDDQLRRLASGSARLTLVEPGTRAVAAVLAGAEPAGQAPSASARCQDPGALAASPVSFPSGTRVYLSGGSGATSCFAGGLLATPRVAVLGSASLLRNDRLADPGVAALDVNTITDSRRLASVVWLTPGTDAAGSGSASLWQLFPSGAYRVFWWLLVVGVLVAVWRARRLGAVVAEPLPVVVRAAELVEGHGRLYARAGARDRAAASLRGAAINRLGRRLGLPRGASPQQVAVAVAPLAGGSAADVAALLAGPPPADDAALGRLARELDTLEAALAGRTEGAGRR
jgi:hypothetical protein